MSNLLYCNTVQRHYLEETIAFRVRAVESSPHCELPPSLTEMASWMARNLSSGNVNGE